LKHHGDYLQITFKLIKFDAAHIGVVKQLTVGLFYKYGPTTGNGSTETIQPLEVTGK
jgi:hypothetical protein